MDTREKAISLATISVINSYQSYFGNMFGGNKKYHEASAKGHYLFVPTYGIGDMINVFYDMRPVIIKDLHERRAARFLDAGCGVGNMMLLAEKVGFNVYGIEFDPEIAEVANALTYNSKSITVGDIAEYNGYDAFDLIYYYVPIKNPKKMRLFAERLAKQMREGAYVLPQGGPDIFIRNRSFKKVEGICQYRAVYKKVAKYP